MRESPACSDPPVASAREFAGWVLSQAGLVPEHYRAEPLARRIPACLRALKVKSPEAAQAVLTARPGLIDAALDALLNGTTGFFRDPAVFETIATQVVPALASRPGALRVLCAACSSGPEAYSVAMVLNDAGLLDRTTLVGLDCRAGALARARVGTYGASLAAPLPARDRYFEPCDEGRRVVEQIRRAITWCTGDITMAVPEGPWDLVLWRNAAMYLAPGAMAVTMTDVAAAVRPGGFLVFGRAERPHGTLRLEAVAPCVYRREAGR